jgi:alkylated DNA repair protein alkB family protein 4
MHPPLALPRRVEAHVAENPDRIPTFDLATQCVADVPGFTGVWVWQDFYSEAEARGLLDAIEQAPFAAAQSGKTKQHFGAKVNFKRRKLSTRSHVELPPYVRSIEARLAARVGGASGPANRAFASFAATDAFVLRYEPQRGANLDFHVDDTFAYGDAILGVSLESDSVLTFVPDSTGADSFPDTIVRVPLPARSAVGLFGPARNRWQHAVLAQDVRARRTSVTLRTLAPGIAGGRVSP